MEEFKLQTLKCNRCGHDWIPRVNPIQCPKCKSYYWNEDREYDKRKKEFRDKKVEPKEILSSNPRKKTKPQPQLETQIKMTEPEEMNNKTFLKPTALQLKDINKKGV